jgi:hypothetical protein
LLVCLVSWVYILVKWYKVDEAVIFRSNFGRFG